MCLEDHDELLRELVATYERFEALLMRNRITTALMEARPAEFARPREHSRPA